MHPNVKPIKLLILLFLRLFSTDFERSSTCQNKQTFGRKEDDPMAKQRKVWLQKRLYENYRLQIPNNESQFSYLGADEKTLIAIFKENIRGEQYS